MSNSTTSQAHDIVPDSPHRESNALFMRWVLGSLGLRATQELPPASRSHEPKDRAQGEAWFVYLDQAGQKTFDGRPWLRLESGSVVSDGAEAWEWSGRFGNWLMGRIKEQGLALHARPERGPMSVTDISDRLFDAYQIDGGQVHLAGCQLTDHAFARLSFAHPDDHDVRHVFVAPDGSSVSDEQAVELGLLTLAPIERLPPRIDDAAIRALTATGRRIAAKQSTSRNPDAVTIEPVAVTLVWIRHAEGRLQFSIGKSSANLPFTGWATLLRPQPYTGPSSGVPSFHLAATDDGRIEAEEQIACCDQSGRRVLRQELVACSVTQQRVLAELTDLCPVTGLPTLKGEFAICSQCRQSVSLTALQEGLCSACAGLGKIGKDDPRLVWILAEHRGLDAWNRWRLSETERVYIAIATSLARRLLLVVDKETLEVQRLATAGRWSSGWLDVPRESQSGHLQ